MADHHHHHHFTSTNWWDTTRTASGSSSSSTTASTSSSSSSRHHHHGSLSSFASWPTENNMVDVSRRSYSGIDHDSSSGVFHDMGLGLSSPTINWNQTLISDKGEGSFRTILHEGLNTSTNYQQGAGNNIGLAQVQWRDINRGFSLDQPHFSPHGSSSDSTVTCQGLQLQPSSLMQIDTSSIYGSNPSTMFQGLLGSHENHQQQQCSMNYQYVGCGSGNYAIGGGGGGGNELILPSSWSKVPQFLRNPPPKNPSNSQLAYWNASAGVMTDHMRPSIFQPQFPATSNFEERQKQNISEVRDSSAIVKKSSGGSSQEASTTTKRPRSETQSPLPAFKVRKEKMGDRITALQQLVSPFGKTDTASVLSEAIEYIKFLHEQVNVLIAPYRISGAPIQHQQDSDKSKVPEGPRQDLRSRGLCLVPVSSTFPVTHENMVDFWTPTFGGTFR